MSETNHRCIDQWLVADDSDDEDDGTIGIRANFFQGLCQLCLKNILSVPKKAAKIT